MKKIILLAGLLITGFAQAQVITATGNGDPISEGETFTFTTLEEDVATLYLSVTNISNAPINIKLKVNAINNNTGGEDVQFCFGQLCYFNIDEGDTVPTGSGVTLAPNGSNDPANHFYNDFPGNNTTAPVSYNLSFVSVSNSGDILDTLLTFNYVYSPTMGANEFASLKSVGISVSNTVVKDVLKLNASQKATVEFYSVNGQLVKSASVAEGDQTLDLSGLSAAVYIAKFSTANNQSSSIRIIKN